MIAISRKTLQEQVRVDQDVVAAIRDAYVAVADGRASVPPVGYLQFRDRNADCHIKYGHIEGDPIFVVKMASGFYDNPRVGLPSSRGISIAASAEHGEIIAVLDDEGWLTELRTAVGGAVATQALCRPGSRHFGIVGAGTQARLQIQAAAYLFGPGRLQFRVWGRNPERVQALVREFAGTDVAVDGEPDLERLCRLSDVLVTTTPATAPLVEARWIAAGTHITAVGADAPGKQELDVELVCAASLRVADHLDQSLDHGEFSVAHAAGRLPRERVIALGDVIRGSAPGRTADEQITIADLTGVVTQDIAVARIALQRATHPSQPFTTVPAAAAPSGPRLSSQQFPKP